MDDSNFENRENRNFLSMTDIVASVKKSPGENQEFVVDSLISKEHLLDLLTCSHEVSLTEDNGKVILTVGTSLHAGNSDKLRERRNLSKLSAHTHPLIESDLQASSLSADDIWAADFRDLGKVLVLIHADGILVYQKPTKHFLEDKIFDRKTESGFALFLSFLNSKGIAFFNALAEWRPNEFKWIYSLSEQMQLDLNRDFIAVTGMVVQEARWGDERAMTEVLKLFNLG